jgi:hypothetical protein
MNSETEQNTGFNQSNDGYTTAGVIQLRLDTAPMLDNIEAFLRGQRIRGYVQKDGAIVPIFQSIGQPKMNDEGIQSIMSRLTTEFNPHTVQGNFDKDDFFNFIYELDRSISCMVMTNRLRWGIKIEEYDAICDGIVHPAQAFFSRLIDNKERESYSTTMRTMESNRLEKNGGGLLNIFNKGGK